MSKIARVCHLKLMQSLVLLLGLTATVHAHPLDELGKTPYLAGAPSSLDIAIALEKNGQIEVGFFIQLDTLMESQFSPPEVRDSYADRTNAMLTEPMMRFAKTHVTQLVEVYSDGQHLSGSLSFRELDQELRLPEDGRVWCQFSFPYSKPNATVVMVVNPVIQEAKVGIINASDSTKSRLTSTSMEMSHAILVQGEFVPDELKKRPQALHNSVLEAQGFLTTAVLYLELGYVHILPKGLDHILFVLALVFLSLRMRTLVVQISIFTAAHTLTLALATAGLITVHPSIVEPLIALSIVFVAIENIYQKDLKPARMLVIFGFGLLHGLGFAGVLSELGLSTTYFYTSLLSFNIGVELGQLSIVAIAIALLRPIQEQPWYTDRVIKPACILIALTGLYWGIERIIA
ncbi:MAG: HupE/UreJ family protein [Bradymonadia bacterium]